MARIQKEHRRIADAIRNRDGTEARRAMRAHLAKSLERYLPACSCGQASRQLRRWTSGRPRREEASNEARSVDGAAGDIGRRLRTLLKPIYPQLR